MAKSTVYPYGTNGELPSSIGLVNDLTTGGVDKALTAEQGKVIGEEIDSLMDGVFGVPHEEAANWSGWNLSTSTPYRAFNICAIHAVAGGSVRVALTSYTTYKIGVVIQNGTAWRSSVISDTGWKTADIDKAILPSEVGYNIRVSIGRVDNTSISLSEFESAINELSFTYTAGENGLKQRVESISDSLANPPQRIPMQVLGGTSYVGKKVDVGEHSYSSETLGTVDTSGQARQGCAVYGDYLFQCFNTNNAIAVFKLSTGQNIQTISLTSNTNNHANSASFGSEKYSAEDAFPCLYISSEGEKKAYVYRITGTEGAFSVTLVQTLSFAGVSYYYPNLHVDAPNMRGIVVGYKVNSWNSEAGNKMLCCCFDLPSPTEGDASLEDSYGEFSFPFIYATQGAFGRYGKLYHSFGNTSQGLQIGGIIVVDYILKTVETFVDLKGAGDFEPEGIGIWDGGIVVSAANGVVRKLTF